MMKRSNREIVLHKVRADHSRNKLFKAALLADIKEALEEVKLYRQGKIQLQSVRDFLAELDGE